MINKLTHTTIYVVDQDRAKDFYVNKLGFECRDDARMGEFRWLTVGPKAQPDFRIVLMAIGSGPPHAAEHAEAMKKLLAAGMLGGGVFVTDDLRRDYKEMTAKGVEFAKEPTEEPYGFAAVFKDDSGNFFSFNEEH